MPTVTADPAESVGHNATERLDNACDYLESWFQDISIAVVLGTGLAEIAAQVQDAKILNYSSIPGFPDSDVSFHSGRLIFGNWEQKICILQGRYHLYEGHSFQDVVFPLDVIARLGVGTVILTHAAGSINPQLEPGSLALIQDHINLTGQVFSAPYPDQAESRFADMTNAYDADLLKLTERIACEMSMAVPRTILGGIVGPVLPTAAEIRMYRFMGIDTIGMSMIPEVVRARQLNIRVLGLTAVTDQSLPHAMQPVRPRDVKQVAKHLHPNMTALMRKLLNQMQD